MSDPKVFSFSTVENFDDHIDKSIENYSTLNKNVVSLAQYFLEEDTNMFDIGCSTGKLIHTIQDKYPTIGVKYHGIEKEPNMISQFVSSENVSLLPLDLVGFDGFNNACLITSIFTLQFIPLRHRKTILQRIYNGLNDGGAFIFSEKLISKYTKIENILTFLYYDYKRLSFTSEEILQKEQDLRHIMKPVTLKENITLLESVGFKTIDVFWKQYDFTGIIAIK